MFLVHLLCYPSYIFENYELYIPSDRFVEKVVTSSDEKCRLVQLLMFFIHLFRLCL